MDSKINILHVINLCEVGGAESLVVQLAARLDKYRFNVAIATLVSDGPLKQQMDDFGVKHFDLNSKKLLTLPFRLRRIIKEQNIAIVQTHGARAELLVTVWARLFGVRNVISTFHGEHGFDKPIKNFFSMLLKPFVFGWISISESVREKAIKSLNLSPEKIRTIHGGIDFDSTLQNNEAIRENLGVAKDEFLVLTVANLRPVKGHETILHAACRLPESSKQKFKFCFLGTDQMHGVLQKKAVELGIEDQVIFSGFQENIEPFLNAADCFLLASKSEGFGLSIIEAMAAGLPIITTRVGGIPEIVQDGQTGLLVHPDAPDEIAEALLSFIDDFDLRIKMGRKASAHVRNTFSLDKTVSEYSDYYSTMQI